MNVYAYVSLVTLVGLVVAYLVGRRMANLGGVAAIFQFLAFSLGLGIFLAFPVLLGVAKLCFAFGITEEGCINTDDVTVWYLAVPLVLFPAYTVCMFVGRALAK